MTPGENIKRLREEKHVTQAELAKCAGISENVIWRIEKNRQAPSVITCVEVCRALKCKISQIIEV